MSPDDWPSDPIWRVALLRAIIRDIDLGPARYTDVVLDQMLAAAWPTVRAQDQ
jgi:hypothetical protein